MESYITNAIFLWGSMRYNTLFETFRIIGGSSDRSIDSNDVDSILEHLRNILNSRHGSVMIADNYGMPDLTNFPGENLGASVKELERIMKATVEKYEPRLTNVRISYDPESSSGFSLKFGLSAEISAAYSDKRTPIFFETVITSDGFVKIITG